ncbi:hypothetical protein ACFE04_025964 [Oxalis oulophora]
MEIPKSKPSETTDIEINLPVPVPSQSTSSSKSKAAPRLSFDFPDCYRQDDYEKVSLFKSRPQHKRHDTWVISVFALLHIVAFVATMVGNRCWNDSQTTVASRRSFGFQPISENPLLGPSASTLDQMGAVRKELLVENHQTWRLFTSPLLHAGAIHLIINLVSVILIGILLEQEFGPLRIGLIYVLSALVGSFTSALFVRNSPAVTSSGALFGLLGAMLSWVVQNWNVYNNKLLALAFPLIVSTINFLLGLLPYVDNFSNIGGFISGFLLGFVLFLTPDLQQVGEYEYVAKKSIFKLKLDRPVLRIVSLTLYCVIFLLEAISNLQLFFIFRFSGLIVAVLMGIHINNSCSWCQYIDCVPSKRWSCNDITASCKTMIGNGELTLTCMGNGNFKVFPFTNMTQSRMKDLGSAVLRHPQVSSGMQVKNGSDIDTRTLLSSRMFYISSFAHLLHCKV